MFGSGLTTLIGWKGLEGELRLRAGGRGGKVAERGK